MDTPPAHSDRTPGGAPQAPATGASDAQRRGPGGALDLHWPAYFDAVEGNPPRDTLLRAAALFESEPREAGAPARSAIDLGCGSGRDSLELLRRGWRVLALDAEAEGIRRLVAKAPAEHRARLTARVEPFEAFIASDHEAADLVNASCTLPFCPPPRFPALWARIERAIRTGGRFSGQFFGERDEWGVIPNRTHLTRAEVEKLLEGFHVEQLEEAEVDGKDAFGDPKHFHIFHVIARRR